jgi:UDP-N-acetylglucosamine:LPS N-acetylglucosamine transferase
MPFPEFEGDGPKVLFFSRGRGSGHAIPDIEIIAALAGIRPDVQVRIVSYGTGALTFAENEYPVIDVGLPDVGPLVDMTAISGRLIRWLQPHLVVSHEEFAVPPVAKIFSAPVVFITEWFTDPEMYSMGALKFADRIIFLGRSGVFAAPPGVESKVEYVGPVIRTFRYRREGRLRARAELKIADDAAVISVFPGSWTEETTPIAEFVADAFAKFTRRPKVLIWIAGADAPAIRRRLEGLEHVMVLERYRDIDQLMASTDVAITKSNRTTTLELNHLGIPTVAISFGLNAPDDIIIGSLPCVRRLAAADLTAERLIEEWEGALRRDRPSTENVDGAPAMRCAHILDEALKALR